MIGYRPSDFAQPLPPGFDDGYKPRPAAYENPLGESCSWKPKPGAGYHHETDTATEWEQDQCVSGALGRGFALVGAAITAIAATGGAVTAAAARAYVGGFNRSAAQEAAAARARAVARARQLALIKARMRMRRPPVSRLRFRAL